MFFENSFLSFENNDFLGLTRIIVNIYLRRTIRSSKYADKRIADIYSMYLYREKWSQKLFKLLDIPWIFTWLLQVVFNTIHAHSLFRAYNGVYFSLTGILIWHSLFHEYYLLPRYFIRVSIIFRVSFNGPISQNYLSFEIRLIFYSHRPCGCSSCNLNEVNVT